MDNFIRLFSIGYANNSLESDPFFGSVHFKSKYIRFNLPPPPHKNNNILSKNSRREFFIPVPIKSR